MCIRDSVKTGKGGVGEKIFEFLLIPRTPGQIQLPALEFSFFNPTTNQYVTRATEPLTLDVGQAAPGAALTNPVRSAPAQTPASNGATASSGKSGAASEPRYLLPPEQAEAGMIGVPIWRWLYWVTSGLFSILAILILFDLLRKGHETARNLMERQAQAHEKSWERLASLGKKSSQLSWNDIMSAYERIFEGMMDAIDDAFAVGSRSFSRAELKQILMEQHQVSEAIWGKIEKILEYSELVRFASSAGAVSQQDARSSLSRWVEEARMTATKLKNIKT